MADWLDRIASIALDAICAKCGARYSEHYGMRCDPYADQAFASSGGWLPIESAPKDGTDILLSNGVVVSEGHWLHAEAYIREHRDLEGRYIGQDEFDGHDDWIDWSGGMIPDPTHWMPLPPPPASVNGEGEKQ